MVNTSNYYYSLTFFYLFPKYKKLILTNYQVIIGVSERQ